MSRQRRRPAGRVRLDRLLVEHALAETREAARRLIQGGAVRVDGLLVTAPESLVVPSSQLAVHSEPAYVSRGGLKLAGALEDLGVDPRGAVAADIGASTGGFTDYLLRRGAARVYAVDVGYGQLAWSLRQDARVVVLERTNARYPLPIPEPLDLATVDVSFISLTLVLPTVAALLKPGGRVLALVKPQFEAGRAEVGRGGVVRDPRARARAVGSVCLWAIDQGLRVRGVAPSRLSGPRGNRELFLLLAKAPSAAQGQKGLGSPLRGGPSPFSQFL